MFKVSLLILTFAAAAVLAKPLEELKNQLPVVNCDNWKPNHCIISEINVTKANSRFQVYNPNPELIYQIIIEGPAAHVEWLSGDICNYFPELTGISMNYIGLQGFTNDAFVACQKLEFFNMQGGLFEEVPVNIFQENRNLLTFQLFDTPIKRILPNQFHAHPNLVLVHIGVSQLEVFPVESIRSDIFQALHVYSSNLKDFPAEELLQRFPILKFTTFNDNDIKCSRVDELIKIFNARQVEIFRFALPKEREGPVGESSGFICIP